MLAAFLHGLNLYFETGKYGKVPSMKTTTFAFLALASAASSQSIADLPGCSVRTYRSPL